MFDFARHLRYTGLSQVWKAGMESLNAKGMLVQSCGPKSVGGMKCTIEHNMAGMRYLLGNSLGSEW